MKKTFFIFILGLMATILGIVSFSYAYFAINKDNITASSKIEIEFPDCISYTIENNSLSLTGDRSAPIQDYKVLGIGTNGTSPLYKTTFTINNTCSETDNLYIGLLLDNAVNSSPAIINSIKYAVYKSSNTNRSYADAKFLNDGTNYYSLSSVEIQELNNNSISATNFYALTPTLESSDTLSAGTYDLYLWIGYDENGTNLATQNMDFNSYLIIGTNESQN